MTLPPEQRPDPPTGAGSNFSSEVFGRLSSRRPSASRYRLEGEIARGGMGAILRVWDQDLRRHLAMKVVLDQTAASGESGSREVSEATLARFLEEAQVTGQLDHPGIVPVHELGLDAQGRVYFTMKLVKGQTLEAVFAQLERGEGGWTQERVLSLLQRVCEAMAYAHDKQVIHRDLKPANVMVGKFGEVYVMDWGLAKVLETRVQGEQPERRMEESTMHVVRTDRHDHSSAPSDSPLYTMDGEVMGTPAYMSPEQAAGRVHLMDTRSDVYALGAMLYHLIAGQRPYVRAGEKQGNHDIWRAVKAGPPAPLQEAAPRAPAELVAICERAMQREPKARYASTLQLAEDLAAYLEGRVVRAYEAGAWAEARKWVRRNRALAGALAAAAVLLVVGLISSLALKAQSDTNAERADAKAFEAEQNLILAQRAEAEARAQTAKVLRLSDVKVLDELAAQADTLWPAYPRRISELEAWVARAQALLANLPGHRATLADMRATALPWSAEERAADRARHPAGAQLSAARVELEDLIARLEQGLSGALADRAEARVAELEPRIAALELEVGARLSWHFGTPEEDWQHSVLSELIADLGALEAGLLADDVITREHGWSIPRRLAFACELRDGFAAGGAYAQDWELALAEIQAAYAGLALQPQMGLVPIGPDPDSGLWEFAHLMTGAPARRGNDERLVLNEDTGLVLVLVPGGSFWMGAQRDDPAGPNYDPEAMVGESPVHEVELSAYLLSKYEMTQGQWLRVTGHNPSAYQQGLYAPTLLHPLEQVSWQDCMTWLPRADLALPSEAQWERGARGGTHTPWWTGAERESLREQHAVNLADQAAARAGGTWSPIQEWPELDDGYVVHAPVGTYAANGFGLHEVSGNLWEWCLDGLDDDFYARSPRLDPWAPWQGTPSRVLRGGSFTNGAGDARSARRESNTPLNAGLYLGVRPARAVGH